MSIKRYIVNGSYGMTPEDETYEHGQPLWVRNSDYNKIQSQLTALTSQLESVVAENAALKAICEDRRQFILNGVEMGFIRLPDKDIKDPAKATYERCLSGMQAAPCQKCNDTGMTDSGGTQPWGEPIEIECDCGAYQLRQGGAA